MHRKYLDSDYSISMCLISVRHKEISLLICGMSCRVSYGCDRSFDWTELLWLHLLVGFYCLCFLYFSLNCGAISRSSHSRYCIVWMWLHSLLAMYCRSIAVSLKPLDSRWSFWLLATYTVVTLQGEHGGTSPPKIYGHMVISFYPIECNNMVQNWFCSYSSAFT